MISVEWLPIEALDHVIYLNTLKFSLAGIVGIISLLTGLLLQQFKNKLLQKSRTMPTDLLISRSIGLILGLFIANLLLAPILLLPLPDKFIYLGVNY